MKEKVSKHFKRDEFKCKCNCGFDSVDTELLEVIESIREYFGRPIMTHCANRCLQHNRFVGSKDTSKHIMGLAVDFHIEGIEHENVYKHIDKMYADTYGIGIYNWGIHVDVRTEKMRWDERTK